MALTPFRFVTSQSEMVKGPEISGFLFALTSSELFGPLVTEYAASPPLSEFYCPRYPHEVSRPFYQME